MQELTIQVLDLLQTLEYVSEEYGGRVELAKAYYQGLTKSLVKNFKGTGLISSMQQCNDFFFLGTHQISLGRVGEKINRTISSNLYPVERYYLELTSCEAHFNAPQSTGGLNVLENGFIIFKPPKQILLDRQCYGIFLHSNPCCQMQQLF